MPNEDFTIEGFEEYEEVDAGEDVIITDVSNGDFGQEFQYITHTWVSGDTSESIEYYVERTEDGYAYMRKKKVHMCKGAVLCKKCLGNVRELLSY